ncbi:MAG: hypothetical protein OWS74_04230, partial [Firmicutes bacterium]|nr:hypothetical protein [Bacillota bacterium]
FYYYQISRPQSLTTASAVKTYQGMRDVLAELLAQVRNKTWTGTAQCPVKDLQNRLKQRYRQAQKMYRLRQALELLGEHSSMKTALLNWYHARTHHL